MCGCLMWVQNCLYKLVSPRLIDILKRMASFMYTLIVRETLPYRGKYNEIGIAH